MVPCSAHEASSPTSEDARDPILMKYALPVSRKKTRPERNKPIHDPIRITCPVALRTSAGLSRHGSRREVPAAPPLPSGRPGCMRRQFKPQPAKLCLGLERALAGNADCSRDVHACLDRARSFRSCSLGSPARRARARDAPRRGEARRRRARRGEPIAGTAAPEDALKTRCHA